jgi:hypothetical protein
MKCLATRNAFTIAMPKAVTSVMIGCSRKGPATLTTSSATRIPQIFT